jgi:hypothetical protein
MDPFEMLYGRTCQILLFWSETGEWKVLDPTYCKKPRDKFIWWEKKHVNCAIKIEKLCRHRRRRLSFKVGDHVYLKVIHMRGLQHFKVRGKLAPRMIGPFKITKERRRIEGRVYKFLFWCVPISGTRLILRGVGLSHPKIPNFGMWLNIQ